MMESVSHAAAHYLMVVSDLLKERGYARGVDVAEKLGISRTAAHLGLKNLKSKGLVKEDERHFYSLPDDTRDLVCQLRGNHSTLEVFFADILGVGPKDAHENACQVEHLLLEDTSRRLLGFLKFIKSSPAGKQFMKEFQKARHDCPHDGRCELCQAYEKCPLGKLEHLE